MTFSSIIFLFLFLPVVLFFYFICPPKYRNILLLIVSLVFYGWGEPINVFVMVITILVNYFSAMILTNPSVSKRLRHVSFLLSIIIDLGILAFFKYTGFIIKSVNALLPRSIQIAVPDIALPIGISFYIFQCMSYVIDLYRGRVEVQRSIFKFGTYVSLFPQLIAGPIVRYSDIKEQLDYRQESITSFSSGTVLFVTGLAKKVLLANRMGALWEILQREDGAFSAWVGMLTYTLQLYLDFSGYSDMATGLGRMFGFEFPKNFNYPYISHSVTEFWRRWHISLSTWFREYVYIPLGGNRLGRKRQVVNILIVWGLTGMWHGASWNYILWGLYFAFWLCLEKAFLLKLGRPFPSLIKNFALMLIVGFGWMLFFFTDLNLFSAFVMRLFSFHPENVYSVNTITAYLPVIVISAIATTPFPKRFAMSLPELIQSGLRIGYVLVMLLLCTAVLASNSYNPFIYFRF